MRLPYEQTFTPFPLHEKHDIMAQEVAAYKGMHFHLVKTYLGKFVAVYQGQLIDHDEDVVTLSQRINENFPDEIVLIRHVEPVAGRILNMRSPRFLSRV